MLFIVAFNRDGETERKMTSDHVALIQRTEVK